MTTRNSATQAVETAHKELAAFNPEGLSDQHAARIAASLQRDVFEAENALFEILALEAGTFVNSYKANRVEAEKEIAAISQAAFEHLRQAYGLIIDRHTKLESLARLAKDVERTRRMFSGDNSLIEPFGEVCSVPWSPRSGSGQYSDAKDRFLAWCHRLTEAGVDRFDRFIGGGI